MRKLLTVVMFALAAALFSPAAVGATDFVSLEGEAVSVTVECASDGYYGVFVEYTPLPGGGGQIERRVLIDGEVPKGFEQVIFNRLFDNTGGEEIALKNGSEIRARSTETFEPTAVFLSDAKKRSSEPFTVYVTKGSHTVVFEPLKGSMSVSRVAFEAVPAIPSYEESGLASLSKYAGEPLTFQAERIGGGVLAVLKSAQSIRNETDYSSPDTVPFHPYKTRLNVIGGASWREPGDAITWEIEVPESGLYGLSFRAAQNVNRGVASYRRVYINGETPFTSLAAVPFAFSTNYRQYDITSNGEYIYLEKGINRVTLENVAGGFSEAITTVEGSLAELNALYRKTAQLTGDVPDKYIDYEIAKKIPTFSAVLKEQSKILYGVVERIVALTGEKGEKAALVETMAQQAARLAADPERVITELGSFKSNISSLGDWLISVSEMPLSIDSFTLYAPDEGYNPKTSGWFKRMWNALVRFLATFFVDESSAESSSAESSADGGKKEGGGALKVWIPTGRDQAQILRSMVDDTFTPWFGISVGVQLIPIDVVLPATLSGTGPDVALDMPQSSVGAFAVRNALLDLSGLDGYGDMAASFYPSSVDAATLFGGVYGLPERETFQMMYVRDDIFAEYGLSVPNTWTEFYDCITKLNIHNYEVYVPTGMAFFTAMLYQNGGVLFEGEGGDYGIATGLYSEASMRAFSDFTKFYTAYKLPVLADFPNRFRTGEMPLGLADYTVYNTLEIFAPEIRGLWSFAPLPGTIREDGTIDRTVAVGCSYSVVMSGAKNKEAAWSFVKWWLAAQTQTDYALQLEGVLGAAGRYNTANKETLAALPWSGAARDALLEQFENTVGIPELPGGYMTGRMVDYAFRSVVTGDSAMSPRQALYMNLVNIDKELSKKREEFGLSVREAGK